ncbi:hypothetical protein UY3_09192 [Chelonia mydas]|uniref:Uncharacterized protein n=1 Tax=Chelonia mydas TaxID=8469 RepID=M7BDJ5_CHEMY|nr:hypothetical protein UY3_09192 [Chelonia mydas]
MLVKRKQERRPLGDIIARTQGKHEGDLTMLATDSVATCNKEENASNLVTRKSSSLPERELCENPPDGPEVILDVCETQKEFGDLSVVPKLVLDINKAQKEPVAVHDIAEGKEFLGEVFEVCEKELFP